MRPEILPSDPVQELDFSPSKDPDNKSRVSSGRSRAPVVAPFTDEAFRAVFDSSGEALIVIDADGVIQRANLRARELLGLRESGLQKAGLAEIFPGPGSEELAQLWNERPSALPRSRNAFLGRGVSIRVTLRSILPGSRHLLVCLEERSLVQRSETRWRRAEAEIRSVLDSVHAAIALFDSRGRLRFFNARLGELLGLNLREMERNKSHDEFEALVAPRFHHPKAFAAPWRAFVEGHGEPGHDELEITRPARRVIERFFRPVLDANGRTIGWLERYSDVTSERQIQSKMLQTEKMAALGQFVSGIAHELNNPLASIMGYAQLLLGKGLKPEQLSDAEKVYQEAERARRIVKNLLYFARENPPERIRVDMNEIVERTAALRSYELRIEDITVECDLAPGLPATMADPYQLQQVVLNLVVNAEQALLEGRGHGHIRIRTRHVIKGLGKVKRDHLLLEVSDDGPGIPPEITSRVFDPFFTSKPSGVGTGLGLSIVYGIVHEHGGEVTFDNQPSEGARFIVDLPVIEAPAKSRADAFAPVSEPARSVACARILVIEDEPTVAQLIVDVLREEGHRVEAVLDSQEGLRLLSRNRYDLVVCDLRMPHLDGQAVYQALRRTSSPIRDRILFITGDVLAAQTREFLERNKLPYLAKPFLVEELKLAVVRLLEPMREGETKADSASTRGRK